MRFGASSFPTQGPGLRSVARRLGGCLAVAAVLAVAGCGSSKPAYCTDRTNLENSVKGLTSLNVSSGISGLESQLQKIQSSANSAVNSAKSDFPTETTALKSSVTSLENAVKGVTSSPTAGQITSIATAASGLVTAVNNFVNATKSKC